MSSATPQFQTVASDRFCQCDCCRGDVLHSGNFLFLSPICALNSNSFPLSSWSKANWEIQLGICPVHHMGVKFLELSYTVRKSVCPDPAEHLYKAVLPNPTCQPISLCSGLAKIPHYQRPTTGVSICKHTVCVHAYMHTHIHTLTSVFNPGNSAVKLLFANIDDGIVNWNMFGNQDSKIYQ